MPGNHEKVEGHDPAKHVTLETLMPFPGANIQPTNPLDGGNASFYTGPEPSQLPVHPPALDHVEHVQPALFGESDILHAFLALGNDQILF